MTDKQEPETQTQIAIRFPDSFLVRLDKLAESLSQPGMRVTRVEALRIAAFRGVTDIERSEKKKR